MPRWFLLLLLTLILQLPGTAVLPLMDRDEPRFAGATFEMLQRQTWLVPYFNDVYRFDKPPLTYWWMRIHYLLGGVNELTARLHSVTATWLTALVILGIGTRLFSARAGMAAAVVWLTSLQVLVHGRLCVADMPMILFVTLSMRALIELIGVSKAAVETKKCEPRNKWFWALYLALGLGFLAKGPVAILAPCLSLMFYRWWGGKPLPWPNLRLVQGLALALAVVAAWGIPALIETEGLFWKVGMGEHVVKRGSEVLNGRSFIPGYYLLTVFLSLFPWSGFLMPVWRHLRVNWSPITVFLLAWFAAPIVIFSFYATQLPHYILPGFPAAALLIGHWLADCWPNMPSAFRSAVLLRVLSVVCFLIPGCLAVGASILLPASPVKPLLNASAVLLLSLGIAGNLLPFVARAQRPWRALFSASLLFALPVHHLCSTLRTHSATLLALDAASFQPAITPNPSLGWDYAEPSLVFYTKSPWTFTGKLTKVCEFLDRHPKGLVIALRREWTLDRWFKSLFNGAYSDAAARISTPQVSDLLARFPDIETQIVVGFNAARMSWVEIAVCRRVPSP